MPAADRKRKSPLVCLCNAVSRDELEAAITSGCTSLGRIFDRTTAGVGACRGSCQPAIRKMLESYQREGKFPEDLPPSPRSRRT